MKLSSERARRVRRRVQCSLSLEGRQRRKKTEKLEGMLRTTSENAASKEPARKKRSSFRETSQRKGRKGRKAAAIMQLCKAERSQKKESRRSRPQITLKGGHKHESISLCSSPKQSSALTAHIKRQQPAQAQRSWRR